MEFISKTQLKANMGGTELWKVLRNIYMVGEAGVPAGSKKPLGLRNIFLVSDCQILNEDFIIG